MVNILEPTPKTKPSAGINLGRSFFVETDQNISASVVFCNAVQLFHFQHPVANTDMGLDILGLRIFFQLFA